MHSICGSQKGMRSTRFGRSVAQPVDKDEGGRQSRPAMTTKEEGMRGDAPWMNLLNLGTASTR